MIAQRVAPITRKLLRRDVPRVESDAAYLSAKLRELALKSYHAVRSQGDAESDKVPNGSEPVGGSFSHHDWLDLHRQIVQLEQALDAQGLDSLASYVASLRQKVESRLV